MRNHKDVKTVTTDARDNYLIFEPNYHTTIFFGKFFGKTNEKKTNMLKLVYLGLSILEICKIEMHEF